MIGWLEKQGNVVTPTATVAIYRPSKGGNSRILLDEPHNIATMCEGLLGRGEKLGLTKGVRLCRFSLTVDASLPEPRMGRNQIAWRQPNASELRCKQDATYFVACDRRL